MNNEEKIESSKKKADLNIALLKDVTETCADIGNKQKIQCNKLWILSAKSRPLISFPSC